MFGALTAYAALLAADKFGCIPIDQAGVIKRSGHYCLKRDLSEGIKIAANDVSLDLGGHCINGPRDRTRVSMGAFIVPGHHRIRISNGCIQDFTYGVLAEEFPAGRLSSHVTVENMTIRDSHFRGVLIYGSHSVVDNVTVQGVGGTTVTPNAYAFGIEMRGDHCRVTNNIIREFYPVGTGEGVGISLSDDGMDHCVVSGNVMTNSKRPETGDTFGLWLHNRALVERNVIVNVNRPIEPADFRSAENTRDNDVFVSHAYQQ